MAGTPLSTAAGLIRDACYIEGIDSEITIHFQNVPEGIADSKSPTWQQTEIIGRSHPILGYSASSPRQVSFTTTYIEDDSVEWPIQRLSDTHVAWLSLSYPQYEPVRPPTRVRLVLGSNIYIPIGVVQDVSVDFMDDAGWHVTSKVMPRGFTVSATIIENFPFPLDAKQFLSISRLR